MKTGINRARFTSVFFAVQVLTVLTINVAANEIDKSCVILTHTLNKEEFDTLKKYTRTYVFRNKDRFEDFDVEYRGKIVVSNDDKDILSISPNGFISVSKSSFGNRRKIYIHANAKGDLIKEYFEGNTKKNYDPDGKNWLSDILPELVLKTGISAEERVDRLVRKSYSALFSELDKLAGIKFYNSSNTSFFYSSKTEFSRNVYNLYLKITVDNYPMTKNELYNFLKYVKNVGSNSTKGNLLRAILEKYSMDQNLVGAFLITCGSLDYNTEIGATLRAFIKKYKITEGNADYFFGLIDKMEIRSEKGNVLKPLLKEQKMDKDILVRFMISVGRISSESEKSSILYELFSMLDNDKDLTKTFIEVVNNMSNSYSNIKEDLLMRLANANESENTLKKDKNVLIALLKNAAGYSTNTKKYILLRKINYVLIQDNDVIYEYFNVINGMDNEFLRYNLLLDLVNKNTLNGITSLQFFSSVSKLCHEDYSHAGGAILREYMKQWPENKITREQFFETVDNVEFSCTVQEILLLLLDRKDLKSEDLFNIIKLTKKLDTDITATEVFLKAKPLISNSDSEVKYIFDTAVEKLEAEYEFNKVVDR